MSQRSTFVRGGKAQEKMDGKMRVIKIKNAPSPQRAAKENNNRRYDQSKESSEEVKVSSASRARGP